MASRPPQDQGLHSSQSRLSYSQSPNQEQASVRETSSHVPDPTSIADTSSTGEQGPLPNPPFVFPARGPAFSSYSRAKSLGSRAALDASPGRFPYPRTGLGRQNSAVLPAFSFGSSSKVPSAACEISPLSNHADSSISSHNIPGPKEGSDGDVVQPSKGAAAERTFLSEPQSNTTMTSPAGRRGHAHRRSAAISCHDLSFMLTPPTMTTISRGSSAPSTPSAQETEMPTFPTISRHVLTTSISDPNTSSRMPINAPDALMQTSKARVGFSDTLEFIPRPLSLVSSDTSSTITMRAGGHSMSDSLSSIVSAAPPSPPKDDRHVSTAVNSSVDITTSDKPAILGSDSTAVSTRSQIKRRNSFPPVAETGLLDAIATSTPKASRRYIFFGSSEAVDPARKPSPLVPFDLEQSSLSTTSNAEMGHTDRAFQELNSVNSVQRRSSSTSRKSSKQQKKVKSWAGSILSRKTKPRSKSNSLNRRSATPPLRLSMPHDAMPFQSQPPSGEASSFVNTPPEHTASLANNDSFGWKPRIIESEEDASTPIIDLDAALTPFITSITSDFDPDWEASQGGPRMKRRMHSSGSSRGYRSNELALHRRTESAPEMERFSLNRLGSSSTMADVFEEEEEEDWEDTRSVSHKSSKTPLEETSTTVDPLCSNHVIDKVSCPEQLSHSVETDTNDSVCSAKDSFAIENVNISSSLQSDKASTEPDTLIAIDREHTPTDHKQPDTSLELPQPLLTPASPSSTFPSPLPSPRSMLSYDAQRLSSTASSFTDDRAQESSRSGEPGTDLRMSVDDVPSLSSSDSTTTRESLANPTYGNPQFRHNHRSASLSDNTIARKRSSIASFTRLLHSSNGEKSPLSMETRASNPTEVRDKSPKSKRFSRLMNFWKPREPAT